MNVTTPPFEALLLLLVDELELELVVVVLVVVCSNLSAFVLSQSHFAEMRGMSASDGR